MSAGITVRDSDGRDVFSLNTYSSRILGRFTTYGVLGSFDTKSSVTGSNSNVFAYVEGGAFASFSALWVEGSLIKWKVQTAASGAPINLKVVWGEVSR